MTDYRRDPMPTPEGRGIAHRAREAHRGRADAPPGPAVQGTEGAIPAATAADLIGFWLLWHLEGGFDGLRRIGMSRSSIYRRIKAFREHHGVHPDEFELVGVELYLAAYVRALGTAQSRY